MKRYEKTAISFLLGIRHAILLLTGSRRDVLSAGGV